MQLSEPGPGQSAESDGKWQKKNFLNIFCAQGRDECLSPPSQCNRESKWKPRIVALIATVIQWRQTHRRSHGYNHVVGSKIEHTMAKIQRHVKGKKQKKLATIISLAKKQKKMAINISLAKKRHKTMAMATEVGQWRH